MSTWPSESTLFNTAITGSDANPLMKAWLQTTKQLLGAIAPQTLVISNGAITPASANILVDTEGGAAADTLSVINTSSLHDGATIMLRAADSSRTVTVQHSTAQGGLATIDGKNVALDTQWPLYAGLVGGRLVEIPSGRRAHDKASTVATTAKAGIVQLSSAVDSTLETLAATPKAVKAAYDKAVSAASVAQSAATAASNASTTADNAQQAVSTSKRVTLKSYRGSVGSWTITGLTVGNPLYLLLSANDNNGSCYMEAKAISGTNDAKSYYFFNVGYTIQNTQDYVSSNAIIVIPTNQSVTISIVRILGDCMLRAYQ